MNILFSFGNIINPHRGGTERVTYLVSEYLKSQGHHIYYLVTEEQSPAVPLSENVFFLPSLGTIPQKGAFVDSLCKKLNIHIVVNEGGTTDDVYFISRHYITTARIITCLHFDITGDLRYFYRGYNFSFKGLKFRDRLLKYIQIIRLPYLKHFHTQRRIQRYRHLCEHSDSVVLLAPNHIDDFCTLTGYSNQGKVICIPNPISYEVEKINLHSKENILLYVGRVSYAQKKVSRVLQIWRRLHAEHTDWRLQLVGDGDDLERCKKLAAQWALPRVEFIGNTNEVEQFYKKAKILLLTSDYEGTPMVVTEAQNYGVLPVVYHSYCGASLHIQHGINGYLIPAFDQDNFVKTLSRLMKTEVVDEKRYSTMCRLNERFAMKQIGKLWNQLLNNVCE